MIVYSHTGKSYHLSYVSYGYVFWRILLYWISC